MKSGRVLLVLGWVLIAAALGVGGLIVADLLHSNRITAQEQARLRALWDQAVGNRDHAAFTRGVDERSQDGAPTLAGLDEELRSQLVNGSAVALLRFLRPRQAEPPVTEQALVVVEGTGPRTLQRGPGRYRGSALPGEAGNFAIAGHRTTYGAPFFHLDQLRAGDLVYVTDRSGTEHVYRVARQEIVRPSDAWVLEPDPLGGGRPTLTLTTCHPRFSNRQRLVVFAELVRSHPRAG